MKLLASVFLVFIGFNLYSGEVSAASSDDVTNYVRRDPEDYNFLPLVLDPGSSTGNTGELRDTISYNMVYDQGYEVQCAKPDWEITPKVYGAIEEYFELYDHSVLLSSDASYNVDFSGGKIPLFRGDEDLDFTQKNSSFEGYFGANYQGSTPSELNSSGVANLLLTTDGQCAVKYANLKSLFGDDGLCSKLQNSDQCVLDREISGTSYTTEKLYDELTAIFAKSDGENNLNCGDITGEWTPDLAARFNISKTNFDKEIKPVAEALTISPLNMDVLSRLAFLIIAPQQSTASNGGIFDFLQTKSPEPNAVNHSTINQDRHAPIVIGFKVPFLATNSLFSLPNLRDSALLAAYSMNGIEELEREQSELEAARSDFVTNIINNKETKPLINCEGLPQCTGGGDSQALFQALMDVVNGSDVSCKAFKGAYENAGDLGSPAEASADKEYQNPYFSKVIPITNSAGFNWSLEVRDVNVQSQVATETVPVSAYLITPYGSNLEYIAESIRILFDAEEFKEMVKNNCIPDFNGECGMIPEYFTFGGITADLDSGSDSFSFISEESDCASLSDPIEQIKCVREFQENADRKSFGATTAENPREPLRILGAELGWMIRKAQEIFGDFGSKAAEYIKECDRTEDLFLGRCLGYQGKPGGSDSEAANSCNDFTGTDVDVPKDFGELKKIVCDVAHNNSNDAQLLWGLTQVEGHPMNDAIKAGKSTMSCGDLIYNDCGASQIVGIITPACAADDWETSCPPIAWAMDDGEAGKKYREEITPDVVCDVRGSLEYILGVRKSQIGDVKALWKAKYGTDPSTEQIYYMLAGKNFGLDNDELTKPACEGSESIDPEGIGCSADNYCVCVMDRFKVGSCN